MREKSSPKLQTSSPEAFLNGMGERLAGYVPDWLPQAGGPSKALVEIYARYLNNLGERVNRAPDKSRLAFLEQQGVNLMPAQAARAPIVFNAMPNVGNSRIPARTRIGAANPVGGDDLIFETENSIALVAAQLAEVVSVWPGKDAYADHSSQAMGGQSFPLFEPLQPIPHEFYLAHDTHFALSGKAVVELQFELSRPGTQSLALSWSYWDGEVWRQFKPFKSPEEAAEDDSMDGSEGFTRSGVIRLSADCARSEPTTVGGFESHWIRASVTTPMPPQPDVELPQINRIHVSSSIQREVWERIEEPGEVSATPTLSGKISDQDGNPMPNITVTLVTPVDPEPVVTDENGEYSRPLPGTDFTLPLIVSGEDVPFHYKDLTVENRSIKLDYILHAGIPAEFAFADGLALDMSKSFYPFGQQPQPGTAFYLSNEEVFSKPGAAVTLYGRPADTAQSETADDTTPVTPLLVAEYWNGRSWQTLNNLLGSPLGLFRNDQLSKGLPYSFEVPQHMPKREVNGEEGRWIRIRVTSRSWLRKRQVSYKGPDPANPTGPEKTFLLSLTETVAPAMADLRAGYTYHSTQAPVQHVVTYNDFRWENHTEAAKWRGESFEPFQPLEDTTPALYLGFDRELPSDFLSLYLDIQEVVGDAEGPVLVWEYHDGHSWRLLTVIDETNHLALPGVLGIPWPGTPKYPVAEAIKASSDLLQLANARQAAQFQPGDLLYLGGNEGNLLGGGGELILAAGSQGDRLSLQAPVSKEQERVPVGLAALPRFGTPRCWIRARRQTGGEPRQSTVNGIHVNAVWASQIQTFENEFLGGSNGQANQAFFFQHLPVLSDEIVEVRELSGARAPIELPILQEELASLGIGQEALRTVTDPRSGEISEVWVRWQHRPNLFFSGPDDRHYVLERSRGRLVFGDNVHGRIPTAGNGNILARRYRSGGGENGNLPASSIGKLMSGVLAESVSNPRPAEGGADGEDLDGVRRRGPQVMRHRQQAISLADYEFLALEASPAVAVARALPTTHPSGRPSDGWVRLTIMPQSQDPQPQPSFGLRRLVESYVKVRAPAAIAHQVTVGGPHYLPIGVEASIAPLDPTEAGSTVAGVQAELAAFLHPLTGGPEGRGWPFGRDVFLSDVAAVIESVHGVDYAGTINLLLDGTPRGEMIAVPPDRIVVAGTLRITLV
jgi:hypothetical protein